MKWNRNWTMAVLAVALVVTAGIVSAQGSGDAVKGKKIFVDHGDFDYPSCNHCHSTVSVKDELKSGKVKIAFPVFNTTHRGAYKNGKGGKGPATSGDAGNTCVKAFQKRKKLPASDIADLNAFLTTVSPSKDVKQRKIKYAPKLPASLDGGDAAQGKKNVTMFCSTCHGKTDDHLQFQLKASKYNKKRVAMKVRGWIRDSKKKSGMRFKPNAGSMSFFAANRLSDKQLLDILAYVGK